MTEESDSAQKEWTQQNEFFYRELLQKLMALNMLVLNRNDENVLFLCLASCSANRPEGIIRKPQHYLLTVVHSSKNWHRQQQQVHCCLCKAKPRPGSRAGSSSQGDVGTRHFWGFAQVPHLQLSLKPAQLSLPSLLSLVELPSSRGVSQPQVLLQQQSSAGWGGGLISSDIPSV